jgi:hypothetical protein
MNPESGNFAVPVAAVFRCVVLAARSSVYIESMMVIIVLFRLLYQYKVNGF